MFNPYQPQIAELDKKIAANQALLNDPELASLAQEEIQKLNQEKKILEDAALALSQSSHEASQEKKPITQANCMIEIRGGAGGDEAKIWANELLRMYLRFCENQGLKIEYLDDLVIKVKGKTFVDQQENYPFELFKYETGVHRVQRVPVTEAQGRIHTSTASVAVLPEIPSTAITIKEEDLDWQFMRSSGAGGQSVNKTSSAVRLTHRPTGIVVTARSERKQAQNRQIALSLLRSQLWEIEEEKKEKELGAARSGIGRAMRAEKIRTYNFPQNRVTDHRINQSWYQLEAILDGDIEKILIEVRKKIIPQAKTNHNENQPAESVDQN